MKFFTASPDLGAIEQYLVNIIYKINRINKTVKMNTLCSFTKDVHDTHLLYHSSREEPQSVRQ